MRRASGEAGRWSWPRWAESRGRRPQLDIVGLVLAGTGLFALTWAPIRAPGYGWGSAQVIGSLAGGVVLMAGFVGWERRRARSWHP